MLGVAVLYTTTELKVVRNYLWALWVADLSHIGLTAYLLGYDRFMAVGQWNAMTWGNIGATVRSLDSVQIHIFTNGPVGIPLLDKNGLFPRSFRWRDTGFVEGKEVKEVTMRCVTFVFANEKDSSELSCMKVE